MRSFWFGLTLPFTALCLIVSKPVLLFWSALPVALTLTLYAFVIVRAQHLARLALEHRFESWGWDAHGWGAWLVSVFASVLLLLVSAFTFSAIASVVASPFNDFLAERAERFTPLPKVTSKGAGAKARLILIDLAKTLAAAVATVFALVLSWVPGLNIVAFAVAFLLIAFQYISYPQTRRGIGIGGGVKFLLLHPLACVGFGAALGALFAVPIVSSLSIPLAVVGGTLLVGRAEGGAGDFRLR
jgi:CysZ protein